MEKKKMDTDGFPRPSWTQKEAMEWYEHYVGRQYDTSGHKKFIRYVHALFQTDEYKKFIKHLREKYDIPRNGFDADPFDGMVLPPPQWKPSFKETEFRDEIKKFCKKHQLHFMDFMMLIEPHLFYNVEFNPKDVVLQAGAFNLCAVADLNEERNDPYGTDFQESDALFHPIAIRFSPYASLRDITDFIRKVYSSEIKPLQKKYQKKTVKLGKLHRRKDSILKRNDFIYKNRTLPRRKIMELVNYHR